AYSAPRLVEYTDPNPCPEAEPHYRGGLALEIAGDAIALKAGVIGTKGSIRVEAQYKVDEYEIVILSATEGRGLDQWLKANGYRIPDGAPAVLQSYIKQGMFFFVAKVDVQEQKRLGYNYLRPIQVAFESPKFVLPIRLGMV